MIQIYGRRKCKATRKAQRFFSERSIPVQNVDLDQKTPGGRELELFIQVCGADALIDRSSASFGNRGLAYMEFDPAEELADDPSLLVTPIVRSGRAVVAGEDEAGWQRLAEGAGR